MHVSVIKCDVWVCLCLIVWQASQLGEIECVCVYVCVRLRLRLKDCFVLLLSFTGAGRREWRMDREEKSGRGLRRGGVGSSIRWDKSRFDLQHSFNPCRVASCTPFLLLSFLLPSRWRISELGFPRLLSEEAIMMFWNTKAFYAQTSAWFGVKERAGLPAKLSLPASLSPSLSFSLYLWPSPPLLLSSLRSSAASLPHKTWQCRQQLGLSAFFPPLLSHSSFSSPSPSPLLPPPHPQALGCDPSCQYCSVFDPRGRRVCVRRCVGGEDVFTSLWTAAACWGGVNPDTEEPVPSVEDLNRTRNLYWSGYRVLLISSYWWLCFIHWRLSFWCQVSISWPHADDLNISSLNILAWWIRLAVSSKQCISNWRPTSSNTTVCSIPVCSTPSLSPN